jgi:hypothetical protein
MKKCTRDCPSFQTEDLCWGCEHQFEKVGGLGLEHLEGYEGEY